MSTASEITRRSEPPSDPFGLKAGDLIDGRFRLRQLLGIGGMGVVWQAEDEELDEIVASVTSAGVVEPAVIHLSTGRPILIRRPDHWHEKCRD